MKYKQIHRACGTRVGKIMETNFPINSKSKSFILIGNPNISPASDSMEDDCDGFRRSVREEGATTGGLKKWFTVYEVVF